MRTSITFFFAALLIILGLILIKPRAGWAAEPYPVKPLLSLERLSFSAGADRVWYEGPGSELPARHEDWEASLLGAYSLTRHLSLAASTRYGLDSGMFSHRVGLRIHLGTD